MTKCRSVCVRRARLLIGVLAVLCGDMMHERQSSVADRVRDRLGSDGALAEASSVGEAALVVSDLIKQVRYIYDGDDEDGRPAPAPRMTVHDLDLPDLRSAQACAEKSLRSVLSR